ncbi:MAG TPA: response regulator [Drouetiella sp.]
MSINWNNHIDRLRRQITDLRNTLRAIKTKAHDERPGLEQTTAQLRELVDKPESQTTLYQFPKILHQILHNPAVGAIILGPNGEHLLFNAAAERLLGSDLMVDALAEKTGNFGFYLTDKVTKYTKEQLPWQQAVQGRIVPEVDLFVRRQGYVDGLWIKATSTALKSESNDIGGAVVFLVDITEQVQVENQIQSTCEALEQQISSIGSAQLELALLTEKLGKLDYLPDASPDAVPAARSQSATNPVTNFGGGANGASANNFAGSTDSNPVTNFSGAADSNPVTNFGGTADANPVTNFGGTADANPVTNFGGTTKPSGRASFAIDDTVEAFTSMLHPTSVNPTAAQEIIDSFEQNDTGATASDDNSATGSTEEDTAQNQEQQADFTAPTDAGAGTSDTRDSSSVEALEVRETDNSESNSTETEATNAEVTAVETEESEDHDSEEDQSEEDHDESEDGQDDSEDEEDADEDDSDTEEEDDDEDSEEGDVEDEVSVSSPINGEFNESESSESSRIDGASTESESSENASIEGESSESATGESTSSAPDSHEEIATREIEAESSDAVARQQDQSTTGSEVESSRIAADTSTSETTEHNEVVSASSNQSTNGPGAELADEEFATADSDIDPATGQAPLPTAATIGETIAQAFIESRRNHTAQSNPANALASMSIDNPEDLFESEISKELEAFLAETDTDTEEEKHAARAASAAAQDHSTLQEKAQNINQSIVNELTSEIFAKANQVSMDAPAEAKPAEQQFFAPPDATSTPAVAAPVPEKSAKGKKAAAEAADAANKRRKILIVDDIPVNQKLLRLQLKRLGFDCEAANNGDAAQKAIANGDFALVLMDLDMPIMDGFESTVAIRKNEQGGGRRIPIVAMTSYDRQEDREKCLSVGMDDFLSKGATQKQLHEVIERCINAAASQDVAAKIQAAIQPPPALRETGLDIESLQKQFDKEEVQDVSRLFLSAVNTFIDCIQLGIEEKDAGAVTHFAHSVKGPCAALGIEEMTRLTSEIMSDAEAGNWTQVRVKYMKLKSSFGEVRDQLRELCTPGYV